MAGRLPIPLPVVVGRLALLEAQIEPNDFYGLFRLTDQFADIVSSCVDLEVEARSLALHEFMRVSHELFLCINESNVTERLDDVPDLEKKTDFDEKLQVVGHALHSCDERARFLAGLVWSTLVCYACFLSSIVENKVAALTVVVEGIKEFPSLASLSSQCSFDPVLSYYARTPEIVAQLIRNCGCEPILLDTVGTSSLAVGFALWAKGLQSQGREGLELLDGSLSILHRTLHFLQSTEAPVGL